MMKKSLRVTNEPRKESLSHPSQLIFFSPSPRLLLSDSRWKGNWARFGIQKAAETLFFNNIVSTIVSTPKDLNIINVNVITKGFD